MLMLFKLVPDFLSEGQHFSNQSQLIGNTLPPQLMRCAQDNNLGSSAVFMGSRQGIGRHPTDTVWLSRNLSSGNAEIVRPLLLTLLEKQGLNITACSMEPRLSQDQALRVCACSAQP